MPVDHPSPAGPSPAGSRRFAVPIGLPMAGYVGLGMSEGVVGVVWPRLSAEFGLPDGGQSLLTASFAVGFVAAALPHGRLLRRFGTGLVLVGAALLGAVGASVLGLARHPVMIAAGSLLLGLSAGALDSGLSSHASLHYPHGRILWMHGGFGVGAFLGPLALTALLASGASWRWSYALLLALEAALLAAWWAVRARWVTEAVLAEHDQDRAADLVHDRPLGDGLDQPAGDNAPGRPAPRPVALVVALGVAGFFFYTGTELSIGNWATTLLLDRQLSDSVAGLATSGYFGAIMVGRFLLGFLGGRVRPLAVVTVATAAAAAGAALFGVAGGASPGLGAVALVATGFCLAGVFPSLVALTPGRVGPARAPSVMGVQLAAASIGAAVLPGAIGLLSQMQGPAAIGPALAAVALVLLAVHVATARAAGQPLLGT